MVEGSRAGSRLPHVAQHAQQGLAIVRRDLSGETVRDSCRGEAGPRRPGVVDAGTGEVLIRAGRPVDPPDPLVAVVAITIVVPRGQPSLRSPKARQSRVSSVARVVDQARYPSHPVDRAGAIVTVPIVKETLPRLPPHLGAVRRRWFRRIDRHASGWLKWPRAPSRRRRWADRRSFRSRRPVESYVGRSSGPRVPWIGEVERSVRTRAIRRVKKGRRPWPPAVAALAESPVPATTVGRPPGRSRPAGRGSRSPGPLAGGRTSRRAPTYLEIEAAPARPASPA